MKKPKESVYLLQDSRTYIGNCVIWWREAGKGYTTDIDDAGHFTKEQAFAQHKDRKSDVPHELGKILPIACRTVDMQKLSPKVKVDKA